MLFLVILQFVARPIEIALSTTALFNTGNEPGIPEHTGHTFIFGLPPNAVEHPQNIFVFVLSSTWTSSPMTASYSLLIFITSFIQWGMS